MRWKEGLFVDGERERCGEVEDIDCGLVGDRKGSEFLFEEREFWCWWFFLKLFDGLFKGNWLFEKRVVSLGGKRVFVGEILEGVKIKFCFFWLNWVL